MSQASRSKVVAARRRKLGEAKMIVLSGAARAGDGPPALPDGALERARADVILSGAMTFDVSVARAYAKAVLEGPACKACGGVGGAEETGDCDACGGSGRAHDLCSEGRRRVARQLLELAPDDEPRPGGLMLVSTGEGMVFGDDGEPRQAVKGELLRGQCPNCHSTGHNLRGDLPPLEWSPAVRRKAIDSELARGEVNQQRDSWTFAIFCSLATLRIARQGTGAIVRDNSTRTVPRGEHRRGNDPVVPSSRVSGYGPYRWCPPSNGVRHTPDDGFAPVLAYAPRWRRGELKHARRAEEIHGLGKVSL